MAVSSVNSSQSSHAHASRAISSKQDDIWQKILDERVRQDQVSTQNSSIDRDAASRSSVDLAQPQQPQTSSTTTNKVDPEAERRSRETLEDQARTFQNLCDRGSGYQQDAAKLDTTRLTIEDDYSQRNARPSTEQKPDWQNLKTQETRIADTTWTTINQSAQQAQTQRPSEVRPENLGYEKIGVRDEAQARSNNDVIASDVRRSSEVGSYVNFLRPGQMVRLSA